jgi:hypothetical protein
VRAEARRWDASAVASRHFIRCRSNLLRVDIGARSGIRVIGSAVPIV